MAILYGDTLLARITTLINGHRTWTMKDGRTTSEDTGYSFRFDQIKPDRKRSKKPKGILPPKPYSFSEVSTRPGYQKVRLERGEILYKQGHTSDQYSPPRVAVPAAMEDRAITKALLKLKNQRVNLGVAMLEAQKTADMFGDIGARVARGVSALRRRKGGEFWQAVTNSRPKRGANKGSVPSDWLAYQYGIVPTLMDAKGIWDELQNLSPWQWVTAVRGVEHEDLVDRTKRTSIGGSAWGEYINTTSIDVKVVLAYMPQKYALQSIARTGMSNPASVVWETVPFSFVLDWFLPVGDALSSLDATVGWEFLHGSCSKFVRTRRHCEPDWGTYSTGDKLEEFQTGIGTRVTFDRSVYSQSPLPRPPRFENPISLGRFANGMALLTTALYGKQEQMEKTEREAQRATRRRVRESVRNYRRSNRR